MTAPDPVREALELFVRMAEEDRHARRRLADTVMPSAARVALAAYAAQQQRHERELREAPSRSRNVIAWTNAQLKVIEEMCEDRIRNPSAFKPLAPSWLRGECERIRGMLTAELHPAHRAGGDDAA